MAVIAMSLWVILAWVLMLVLTAKQSWPAAYGLILIGLPIVVWLGVSLGPVWAIGGAVTMGLVLRWPLRYFLRWLKGLARR